MADLIILTGYQDSRKEWADRRAKAHGWQKTHNLNDALELMSQGINVVLDNDLLAGHDVINRHFRKEREYKPYSKEEENNR